MFFVAVAVILLPWTEFGSGEAHIKFDESAKDRCKHRGPQNTTEGQFFEEWEKNRAKI